jgi:xylan 1,4-beta-xylosidase
VAAARPGTDFDGPDLPIDFQWLRSPFPDELFSLTARPGWLRLHGRETIGSQYRQALVARRQQAFCYSARTVLDFAPEHFQQAAGLVCYYGASKFHYLFVSRDDEHGRHLQVMSALPDSPQADAFTAPIPLPDDGPGPPAGRGRFRAPALRLQPGRRGLDLAAPGVRRLDPVGRSHRPRRAQLHRRLRRHGLPGPVGRGLPADFDGFGYVEREYRGERWGEFPGEGRDPQRLTPEALSPLRDLGPGGPGEGFKGASRGPHPTNAP